MLLSRVYVGNQKQVYGFIVSKAENCLPYTSKCALMAWHFSAKYSFFFVYVKNFVSHTQSKFFFFWKHTQSQRTFFHQYLYEKQTTEREIRVLNHFNSLYQDVNRTRLTLIRFLL